MIGMFGVSGIVRTSCVRNLLSKRHPNTNAGLAYSQESNDKRALSCADEQHVQVAWLALYRDYLPPGLSEPRAQGVCIRLLDSGPRELSCRISLLTDIKGQTGTVLRGWAACAGCMTCTLQGLLTTGIVRTSCSRSIQTGQSHTYTIYIYIHIYIYIYIHR